MQWQSMELRQDYNARHPLGQCAKLSSAVPLGAGPTAWLPGDSRAARGSLGVLDCGSSEKARAKLSKNIWPFPDPSSGAELAPLEASNNFSTHGIASKGDTIKSTLMSSNKAATYPV